MIDKYFLIDNKSKIELTYKDLIENVNNFSLTDNYSKFVYLLMTNQDIHLYDDNLVIKPMGLKIQKSEDIRDKILQSKSNVYLKSSGTSGEKKFISHKISSLLEKTKKAETSCVWGMCYNFKHMGGLQVILQSFVNLNTLVVLYGNKKKDINNCIQQYAVTHISATPTFYRINFDNNNRHDTVRRITLGGELSTEKDIQNINTIFPLAKINNIYATTETGVVAVSSSEKFKFNKNLRMSNKNTLEIFYNGNWIETDDIISKVDSNNFVFIGRESGFLNVGGHNINPNKIESLLRQMKGVKNAYRITAYKRK